MPNVWSAQCPVPMRSAPILRQARLHQHKPNLSGYFRIDACTAFGDGCGSINDCGSINGCLLAINARARKKKCRSFCRLRCLGVVVVKGNRRQKRTSNKRRLTASHHLCKKAKIESHEAIPSAVYEVWGGCTLIVVFTLHTDRHLHLAYVLDTTRLDTTRHDTTQHDSGKRYATGLDSRVQKNEH
jgi:hypothetical protein